MNFLTNLNLNKNQLQNAVLHPLATAPSNPKEGQVYYNSVDKLLYQYNGSAWVPAGELNVIETVKVNGTALTPTGKAVDVTVPTKTSEITNDSGFITSADVPEGAAGSTTTPKMNGTAAVGTETAFARGDHVHPSDTTKVDKVSGKGLSTNDYTTAEKTKLAGIATGAEVNQNAFSTVKVDGASVDAGNKTDSIEFTADDGIAITADDTLKKVHFTLTGDALSPVKWGQAYCVCTTAEATKAKIAKLARSSAAGAFKLFDGAIVTVEFDSAVPDGSTLQVESEQAHSINLGWGAIQAGDTATFMYSDNLGEFILIAVDSSSRDASQAKRGLMSAADKTKLDGVETGAQVNSITGVKGNAESSYRTGNVNMTPANIGALAASLKGAANGVAELDSSGKVPASQLPSYVDDVLEYNGKSAFPATGETGKIYVDTATNLTYRWSGTAYVEISPSLALGETESTAYRGDRGKTAYDHSQLTSGNPHNVTKSDVGLGNVDNTSDATKKTNFTGSIASGNTGFVKGGDAYTALNGKLNTSGGTMSGAIAMGGNKITGLGTPTADADAATKKYVDTAAAGAKPKSATGTIAATGTSAEVSYTGTLIASYAVMGGAEVVVEKAITASKVTFSTASAPGAAITCTVIYV